MMELLLTILTIGGLDIASAIPDPLGILSKATLDAQGGVVFKTVPEGFDASWSSTDD